MAIDQEPKWYKDDSLNDSELGGMGAADYDVEEEFGLLTIWPTLIYIMKQMNGVINELF